MEDNELRQTNRSTPRVAALSRSMEACIVNGNRIIRDAMMLEFEKPPASKLVLSMAAQEEYAKAFLLYLVRGQVIPWTRHLLRAMNDHACKQLVGIVIEYLEPDWDTVDMRIFVKNEVDLGPMLPPAVASAMNILRHEKLRRWESNSWVWAEDPEYDKAALKASKGERDQIRQDALYVRLAPDGQVVHRPTDVAPSVVEEEFKRAERYGRFMKSLLVGGDMKSEEYKKVINGLRALFDQGFFLSSPAPASDT